jgi:hypothetical protein
MRVKARSLDRNSSRSTASTRLKPPPPKLVQAGSAEKAAPPGRSIERRCARG